MAVDYSIQFCGLLISNTEQFVNYNYFFSVQIDNRIIISSVNFNYMYELFMLQIYAYILSNIFPPN